MSSNNSVNLVGNLTADPQLRVNDNTGKARATFSIAINKPDRNGEKQQATFVDVTVLSEPLARNVCESLTKGAQAIISGELNSYTTEVEQANGEIKKIGRMSVNAWEVGVSLRFATAKPVKVVREGNDGQAQGGSGQSQPDSTQGGQSQSAPSQGQDDSNDF